VDNLLASDIVTYHTCLHILKLGLCNFCNRSFMLKTFIVQLMHTTLKKRRIIKTLLK